MTKEYYSRLIARLQFAKTEHEFKDVLNTMGEIGDPIFIYPIYYSYKLNRDKFFSHYFISALEEIDSADVPKLASEIVCDDDPSVSWVDRDFALRILTKNREFEPKVIEKVTNYLQIKLIDPKTEKYDLYDAISFLEAAKELNRIEPVLHQVVFDGQYVPEIRKLALNKWVRIDPKINLDELHKNLSSIQNDKPLYLILAQEISGWNGGIADKIKEMILIDATSEAGQALASIIERKQSKEKDRIIEKNSGYINTDLIKEIIQLRQQINTQSQQSLGTELLLSDESLLDQIDSAKDRQSLVYSAVKMRGTLSKLTKDLEHGLDDEAVKQLLPHTLPEDFNKPMNRLYLFLKFNQIEVDQTIFGYRKLVKCINMLGAHEGEDIKGLIKSLEEMGWSERFNNEDWEGLHYSILEKYKMILSEMLVKIKAQNT